jgi:type III pantothenate kinase
MNVVVDIGNSRIKVAHFNGGQLLKVETFNANDDWKHVLQKPHQNIIVSSVASSAESVLNYSIATEKKIQLTHETSLPIAIKYATPETLGVDRIAAACGAMEMFPRQNCLVIDVGTCINYEVIDAEHVYWGGLISPGVAMRFKAMHTFTARLPLLHPEPMTALIGNSTQSCMQSGVMHGTIEEMQGIINKVKQSYPALRVILSGGDAHLFENQLKPSIFAAPELVLVGLNRILNHNVSQ